MTSLPAGEARRLAIQFLGDLMKDWDPADAREALAGIESIDVHVSDPDDEEEYPR